MRKLKLYSFFSQYLSKKFWFTFQQRLPNLAQSFLRHFPAIQLKRKMDNFDYALNFSSELVVVVLVLVVALANIFSFGLSSKTEHDFSDNSLAGSLLANHNTMNLALYAKESSIKTSVVRSSGIVSTAYAEDSALSATGDGTDANSDGTDTSIQDNVMTAPTPDTTRELMAKQIQVYETQPGDTISSLAQRFNISQDTIRWANHVDSLKPGWFLKILPTSGVLYQATSNDTLPDIAKYFNCNLDTIISYNALENAEDISPGQWIIGPGCSVPAPKVKPGKASNSSVPHGIPVGNGHSFPYGYCTYYVATKFPVHFGGNARAWLSNAKASGYATGQTAAVGSVVVTNESRVGHVAYVEAVNGDGTMTISEMNYVGFAKTDTRRISVHDSVIRGFIYR